MRNDSEVHYREIRFNMQKPRFMRLLFANFHDPIEMMSKVLVYGEAKKRF